MVKITFRFYYILMILHFGVKLCEDGVNDAATCGEIKDYIFICKMYVSWCYEWMIWTRYVEQTVSREGSVCVE